MATTNPLKIIEVCGVKPSPDSPKSSIESSLPLTYFDTFWLKFHPAECLFFYQLSDSTRSFFNSDILPKLKSSLSLALVHFQPIVAGKIRWPSNASKPSIIYNPNDTVLVTVAESNADLSHLISNGKIDAIESRFYIPEFPEPDSEAATVVFKITLFPNQGFSIGVASHHAIFDAKSIAMFMKAWAYICKQSKTEQINPLLPPELTPFLDRSCIQDPEGLDLIYANNWLESKFPGLNDNPRTLKLLHVYRDLTNFVRSTFELSREDIKKLRGKVISELKEDEDKIKSLHLSTFVLSFAYTLVCIVKARKLQGNTIICFVFGADCRARLNPPLPENYFGNCVKGYPIFAPAEALIVENGVSIVIEKLSEKIKGLEKEMENNGGEKETLARYIKAMESGPPDGIGVSGSPKFGFYGTDFGWGKPKKVEIPSIDKSRSISMMESKDGSGGIEIGLVLNVDEMEMFHSLFVNGLKDL